MGISVVSLGQAVATNSVANQTGVDLRAAAQIEAGPVFPNVGAGNSVVVFNISPGSTPGAYTIRVEESDDDSTYTAVTGGSITEATSGGLVMQNVTIAKPYARLAVTDATANAGTVDCYLLNG